MHWSKTKEGRRKLRLQTKKMWRDGVFAKKVRVGATMYRSAGNPLPSALAIAQTLVSTLRREAKERRRAMKKLKKLLLQ